MNYPERYKTELLNAIESIDLAQVQAVIQILKVARTEGHRIFVCGEGRTDLVASQFLCEMVEQASFNRSERFRALALTDRLPRGGRAQDADRVFVEQVKSFAEPGDVVIGISVTGNSANVVNAIDYAGWIGCRTIAVTGGDGGKLASLADVTIRVPVAHVGSIEDAHMIICHMIGYYFVDFEKPVVHPSGDPRLR